MCHRAADGDSRRRRHPGAAGGRRRPTVPVPLLLPVHQPRAAFGADPVRWRGRQPPAAGDHGARGGDPQGAALPVCRTAAVPRAPPGAARRCSTAGGQRMTADLVARFDGHREQMFGIAYRMLASRAEAEDVLQEAWLRFAAAADAGIDSDRAFLSTVVTRLCLDRLKSAAARRESYVGPWLPEPIRAEPDGATSPDDRLGRAESVSFALLLALETLSPLERAVLILREVFDVDFDEVAAILETSPAACRQLLHRARVHVRARRPRYPSSREQHVRLATAFFTAAQGGDPAPLMNLLAENAVAIADGGGRVPSARKPIQGREAVARFIAGLARMAGAGVVAEVAWLNGCLGIILRDGGRPIYAALAETDGEQVVAVRLIANPDKLRQLDRPLV